RTPRIARRCRTCWARLPSASTPQPAQANCWKTVIPGRIRSPASRTTSSNGCSFIAGAYWLSSPASIALQRLQPPACLPVLSLEDLVTLLHLPLPIGAGFLGRIYRTPSLGWLGQELVGLPTPRPIHLVDGALHVPHDGFSRHPARPVDLTITKFGST